MDDIRSLYIRLRCAYIFLYIVKLLYFLCTAVGDAYPVISASALICMTHCGTSLFVHAHRQLTWWLGKINVSAITTFSRRPAANTMTSAMSSGVSGSQPLSNLLALLLVILVQSRLGLIRIDSIRLALVSIESDNGEFLGAKVSLSLAFMHAQWKWICPPSPLDQGQC